MSIPVGTKSLLFGVHAFWWHPIVVARAWRMLYGKWPTMDEWVAIIVHDWGYWGCKDMDGPCGLRHPELGAKIARGVVFSYSRDERRASVAWTLAVGHSGKYAYWLKVCPSRLCAPDKCATLLDPWWWYKFRATLSGELQEYMRNGPLGLTPKQWFRWIQSKFRKRYVQTTEANKNSQLSV
jgi:hypothetical protein